MSQGYDKELTVIETACQRMASSHKLADSQRAGLEEQFGDRFKNALELVEKRKVHRYQFKPSGRTIWTVKGRKGVYQVISETNFCNCDDYYFRVMDGIFLLPSFQLSLTKSNFFDKLKNRISKRGQE